MERREIVWGIGKGKWGLLEMPDENLVLENSYQDHGCGNRWDVGVVVQNLSGSELWSERRGVGQLWWCMDTRWLESG
jgi:hypothetical protein